MIDSYLNNIFSSYVGHRMALVSFRLFRKNLGNLKEFFGQMVHRPPGKKMPERLWPLELPTVTFLTCLKEKCSKSPFPYVSLYALIFGDVELSSTVLPTPNCAFRS